MANLALFDLDHTLIDIDSGSAWFEYVMVHLGQIEGLDAVTEYRQHSNYLDEQYFAGKLDFGEYARFVAILLAKFSPVIREQMRQDFVQSIIIPSIRPHAISAIKAHQMAGDTVVITTATSDFVASGVIPVFGIDLSHALMTRIECIEGRYTGNVLGVANFQEGKIVNAKAWIQDNPQKFDKKIAYSDSLNDLPLLQWVDEAICVTPDEKLTEHARQNNWRIVDWSLSAL